MNHYVVYLKLIYYTLTIPQIKKNKKIYHRSILEKCVYPRYKCTEREVKETLMVNFMCQLEWARDDQICGNTLSLGVSVRVFGSN